ncbi:ABC transporter permease [Natrialba swarupiae]|uniref:ABC transporter permease subunit n=1 Tax=Natrialba swarupiae TaxID=2448032 RepID=A0A5D5ANY8_9EURY|nr:ABC transporter permease subunit [Natrialba swarupiae]TYT61170.1 ABC transporter permease subunit [Natrialba swarupiae]
MRWYPLAREETKALLRSKGVWLLALVLLLWTYRPSYVVWNELGPDMTVGFLQYAGGIVVPIAAVILGYRSIVGERASGSLKLLLGLPLTRGEILLGKLVGRLAGIAIPAFLALGIVTVAGVVQYGLFSPLRYLAVFAVTALYFLALVSIVISVSAIVRRTTTAAATLFIGFILILEIFWQMFVPGLYSRLTGVPVNPYDPPAEGGLFLMDRLSPTGAYNAATNGILDAGNSAWHHSSAISVLRPGHSSNALAVGEAFDPGTAPLYLHEAGGIVILVAWIVTSLSIAYLRFDGGDLA